MTPGNRRERKTFVALNLPPIAARSLALARWPDNPKHPRSPGVGHIQVLSGVPVVCTVTGMTNEERKQVVRELLGKGQTLSQILDTLHKEKGDPITYMELRLLLSEMPDAKLPEKELPKTVLPPAAPPGSGALKDSGPAAVGQETAGGKLSISVDQMPTPGTMLSGYARFSSGAKAHWFLDEMGRLGVEPELGSGKATPKDMQEFTTELRRMLQQTGGM